MFKLSRPNDLNIQAAITNFDGETFYYENGIINQQNSLKDNLRGLWLIFWLYFFDIKILATLAKGAKSPEAPKEPWVLILGRQLRL